MPWKKCFHFGLRIDTKQWFEKSAKFDLTIAQRFAHICERAAKGN